MKRRKSSAELVHTHIMTQCAVRPDAITVETGHISSLHGRKETRLLTQADARGHMAVQKIHTSVCEIQ